MHSVRPSLHARSLRCTLYFTARNAFTMPNP